MSNDTQISAQEQAQEQVEKTKLIIISAKTGEAVALEQPTDHDEGESLPNPHQATGGDAEHKPPVMVVVGRINTNGKTATFQKYPKVYRVYADAAAEANKLACDSGCDFGCFEQTTLLGVNDKFVIGRSIEDGDGITFQRWSPIMDATAVRNTLLDLKEKYPENVFTSFSLRQRFTGMPGIGKKKEKNLSGDSTANYKQSNPVSYALTHELRDYLHSIGNKPLRPDTPINVEDEDGRIFIYRHGGGHREMYHSPLLAAVRIYEFLTSVGYFKDNSTSTTSPRAKPTMVRAVTQFVNTDGKPIERAPATRKFADLNPIAVINQLSNWKEAYVQNNPDIGFPAGTPKRYLVDDSGTTCQVLFEGKGPRSFTDVQSALSFIVHFVKTASTNTRKGQSNPYSSHTPIE